MSHSLATCLNGYRFPWWKKGLLCSKYAYQNTVLSVISKCIQVGGTAPCTHEQPTGHSIKYPGQSQVSQKCIKGKF